MKKALSTLCAAIILFIAATPLGCAAAGYTVFPARAVFSDDILFSAQIIGGRADYAYNRMCKMLEDIDSQVSATAESSAISRFNASVAGQKVEVGEHAYALFALGVEYYELTDGAFNIAAAPLSELWKVDAKSLSERDRSVEALPTPEDVEATLAFCSPRLIKAEEQDGKYYLTKSDSRVKLDFGGLAKGYAADMCKAILDEYTITSAIIDISGNAYFYGDRISGGVSESWNVGIISPRPRVMLGERGYVCAVTLPGNVSAVTSGDYMRYYTCGELFVAHIIGTDGVPVGIEWDSAAEKWGNTEDHVISATVLGADSALCDALSTAVTAKGLYGGGRLLQKCGCKGLIFTEKRYTIIGDVAMYKPDVYDGFRSYEYYEL